MSKYRRMTLTTRCQIDLLLQEGLSQSEISVKIGFHKSSVSREICRNFHTKTYVPKRAQELAQERYKSCRRHYKITPETSKRLETYLNIGWSPQQISKRFAKDKILKISHECIYQFVGKNLHLKKLLRRPKKRGFSRYSKTVCRPKNGKNIALRPNIVNRRSRIGDWERDLFYGANRKQILICTERKSRFIKLSKLNSIDSKTVGLKTEELIKALPRRVHTITNDNGTEFKGEKISIRTFFCDPRKPQQRGTVENTIGLLRQYISLKVDLTTLSDQHIKMLEDKLNHRPRKVLGYKTPFEVFFNKSVALAI